MTCTPFKVGQVTGIACTRLQKRPCRFCKRAATRLCDGRPATGRAGTCDVPLCKAHAHTEGERDLCPKCHARPELPFPVGLDEDIERRDQLNLDGDDIDEGGP